MEEEVNALAECCDKYVSLNLFFLYLLYIGLSLELNFGLVYIPKNMACFHL